MNRDDLIRWSLECGGHGDDPSNLLLMSNLEDFANRVAAENDKKWQALFDKIDEYASVCNEGIKLSGDLSLAAIDVAVTAEREACARVCDEVDRRWVNQAEKCAERIRARGEE